MQCDEARDALSALADGELPVGRQAAVGEHAAQCPACASWRDDLETLRRALRYAPAHDPADVAPEVTARLRSSPSPRARAWLQAAAVFLAAFLAGSAFVGLDVRQPATVVAGVPDRVAAAQRQLLGLSAGVEVVERGWHPEVVERRFRGTLRYLAPEHLALRLEDRTRYPDDRWVAGDVDVVSAGSLAWTRGPAPCPVELLPSCQAPLPRVRAVEAREPFDAHDPVALDLVLPVRSFAGAPDPEPLGSRSVGEREAVGVAVDAAQAAPLLDGLRQAGHWREIHPTDRVELWLDAGVLVPLEVRVLPSADPDRELWAARRGYRDEPGRPVLELRLSRLHVEEAGEDGPAAGPGAPGAARLAGAFPGIPAGVQPRDLGFTEAPELASLPAPVPEPGWLPQGMHPHRHGWVSAPGGPRIGVATWTDGQAWVKLRATAGWAGGRLFGDLGGAVRPVTLGGRGPAGAGVAYVGEGGTAVALHARDLDLVVAGSVGEDGLLRVAESLGVTGRPVPPGWEEAASESLESLVDSRDVLVPAVSGFSEPAVRLAGDAVTLTFTGPGARGFVLTHAPGAALPPPLSPDVRGVQVRGTAGRYHAEAGELEWVERGQVVSLRSRTLPLPGLVAVAEGMRWR